MEAPPRRPRALRTAAWIAAKPFSIWGPAAIGSLRNCRREAIPNLRSRDCSKAVKEFGGLQCTLHQLGRNAIELPAEKLRPAQQFGVGSIRRQVNAEVLDGRKGFRTCA